MKMRRCLRSLEPSFSTATHFHSIQDIVQSEVDNINLPYKTMLEEIELSRTPRAVEDILSIATLTTLLTLLAVRLMFKLPIWPLTLPVLGVYGAYMIFLVIVKRNRRKLISGLVTFITSFVITIISLILDSGWWYG